MARADPIAVAYLVVTAISLAMAGLTARNWSRSATTRYLSVLFLAVAAWSATTGLRHPPSDIATKRLLSSAKYLGESVSPPLVFLFVAAYTNRTRWHRPRRVATLFLVPLLTNVFVWTDDWLPVPRVDAVSPGATPAGVSVEFGPWYWVHFGYSYLLALVAIALAARAVWEARRSGSFFDQRLLVLVALLTPTAVNVPYALDLLPVDPTPAAFVVTGSALLVAIRQHQLLDIQPIARSIVMDTVDEGVVVLDTENHVVDANEAAVETLGLEGAPEGQPAATAFEDAGPLFDQMAGGTTTGRTVTLDDDGESRHLEVDVSHIRPSPDALLGRTVVFKDVTEQVRRQRDLERRTEELERQNDRLDEFASVVSHDLRNPLNVLRGELTMARETGDEKHLDEMERSVERMETLIEEVLTLARQGRAVADRDPLDLGDVAREAWANVDTGAATLRVDLDRRVDADRDRLLQVFENLYRNSIDHGRPDVTVRVQDLEGGFVVADDGPGIPADRRDQVFERGYTTAEEGTGFGLSIVRTAVEAHGWTIDAVEPRRETEGARFEVRGIEPADPPDSVAVS